MHASNKQIRPHAYTRHSFAIYSSLIFLTRTLALFSLIFIAPIKSSQIDIIFEDTSKNKIQEYFLSLQGAYYHVTGDLEKAAETYNHITTYHPEVSGVSRAQIKLNYENKNYPQVIASKDKILPLVANETELPVLLAQAYIAQNELSTGINLLKQIRAHHGHDPHIQYYYASALLKARLYISTERVISEALNEEIHESKHFLFYFLRAKSLFLQGKLTQALRAIQESLQRFSGFTKGLFLQALIYEKMGDKKKAIVSYEKYSEQSNDRETDKKLIGLLFATKQYGRAYKLLLKHPEQSARYWHDASMIALKMGDLKRAHKHLKQARTCDPQFQKLRLLQNQILLAEKKHGPLLTQMERTLKKFPNNKRCILYFMRLRKNGFPEKSIREIMLRVIRHSMKKGESTLLLNFALGDMLHENKEYSRARTHYQAAYTDSNQLLASKIAYQIARTLFYQHALDQPIKPGGHPADKQVIHWLERATSTSPVYPSAYNLKALWLIHRKQDFKSAKQTITKALRADPKNSWYLATKELIASSVLQK